jgi:hypothetical protein
MALQGPDAPTPGDLTVCLHCGAMLRFGSELALLHRVSDREFYALPVDARMALVRARALVDKVRT